VVLTVLPLYASRYVLQLRVPQVSRPVQEIADFVSGIVLGTALAMVFRLWAVQRFVFPHAQARPRRRTVGNGPRSDALWHPPVERPARDTPAG
jgi:hypothetical protein